MSRIPTRQTPQILATIITKMITISRLTFISNLKYTLRWLIKRVPTLWIVVSKSCTTMDLLKLLEIMASYCCPLGTKDFLRNLKISRNLNKRSTHYNQIYDQLTIRENIQVSNLYAVLSFSVKNCTCEYVVDRTRIPIKNLP